MGTKLSVIIINTIIEYRRCIFDICVPVSFCMLLKIDENEGTNYTYKIINKYTYVIEKYCTVHIRLFVKKTMK